MLIHLLLLGCLFAGPPRPDLLIADFEGGSYGGWRVEGMAFETKPARGTLPNQMRVDGFVGKGLVNSFVGGDASTGTLTSPKFRIQRKFIIFRIGGGKDPDRLALELWIGRNRVRRSTGPNDRPGGSERLEPSSWDVGEYAGQAAELRIIDQATGGWGHINVDHIKQSDTEPIGMITDAKRQFLSTARYLNLPIQNGAPKRTVTLLVDGHEVVRNNIELADGPPDWWAPMDVSQWKGRSLTLRVDQLPGDSTGLSSIRQSDQIPGEKDLYREALRGQFHFSPRRGWTNDPNGMVFYNGEYHLFFQHNPYGWSWENMHWGHAVSRDMVHWTELPEALLPDAMGPMFSGSAVIDWHNSSGLGSPEKPPMVLFYTAAGKPTVQCLAYSTDGRTFTKYAGNPILPEITDGNRDPKVFWHAPSQRWVMTLYVEVKGQNVIQFFSSNDLKSWSFASQSDGFFECPDFFELPVDGDPKRTKWVLTAASSDYRVGAFDGRVFTPETPMLPGHRGKGFYAAQTFSDIPAGDGRRIQIGWFQTETPGMPFNQAMSLPLVLRLISTPEGPRLAHSPVKELTSLRTRSHVISDRLVQPGDANPFAHFRAELVEIEADIEPQSASQIHVNVRGASLVYDVAKQELTVNGHAAPAPLQAGRLKLHIFCDRIGLEVFASEGLCFVPMPFLPKSGNRTTEILVTGGRCRIESLRIHELRSAWIP